ncbi:glycosyl transferase [Mycobacteriaceae bacterium 1482268.1]|nr:glycosyl transferase [Mycobacteriaceae bacterium 1482268.1]
MKIAMVSAHANLHVQVTDLSAALARRGHDVSVYLRRDHPDQPDQITAPQGYTLVRVRAGPLEPMRSGDLLQQMGEFARYLDARWAADRPDVTHAHFWMAGIATQLAARHLGLPAVQTFHALGAVKGHRQGARDARPKDRLEAAVARSATWVAATCTGEVVELMRMGRSRTRISVVPCGVDQDLFRPDGTATRKGAKHRILGVGRLVPGKGFDDVIRAMPSIPNAELVVVGGPDKAELDSDGEACRLRALAKELGVGRRVHLHGGVAREGMPAMLRSADVVACAPWYQSSGIVPLEAMACGIPVVASAVGDMLDSVVHDVTGRLISPKKPAEIAAAINPLLRDPFLRQSLGLAGRDRVCARYSWDRIAAETLRIYDQVAQSNYPRVSCDF